MIEELKGSLLKLLTSYTNNYAKIGKKVTDPLAPVETEETLRARLKPLIQEKFKQFSNELTERLEEINASYQFMSSILPEYEKLQSLTESITYLNEILDQVNGLTVDGDALDEFCKNFGKDESGKSPAIDGLLKKIDPEKIKGIQPNLANVQKAFMIEAGKSVVGQREKLTQKIKDVQEKLNGLEVLSFIPEVKDFIEKTTSLLEPAKNCTYSEIATQMQRLDGIEFAQFDKAKDKYNTEKQRFEDEKFGDLKQKLEELKTTAPELTALIDSLLAPFELIESPTEMNLETFEKDETSLIGSIETPITNFINQQANLIYDLSPFSYAIEPSKLVELQQLTLDLKGITKLTPENLEKAVLLQQLVNKIRDDLKAKKLLADDDKSHRLDAPNDSLVGELGAINQDIMDVKTHPRNISDQESEQRLQKNLELLRQRCVNLQGKDGNIEAHQREIAVQRSTLIREKNAEALDIETTRTIVGSIKYKTKTYNNTNADTSFENDTVKKEQLNWLEGEVFNEKNRTQRNTLLDKRNTIINKYNICIDPEKALASVNSIHVNTVRFLGKDRKWKWLIERTQNKNIKNQQTQFQADLRGVLQELQEIDIQLLGSKKASMIYAPIFERIPHLIGGTQVMIPQHLIDLQEALVEANKAFKH